MATIMARPAAEAVRRRAEEDGIEFFFAQFVDMNAKPSAKLVPMSNFDGLVTEDFTLATMPARFAELGDVQAGIDDTVNDLRKLFEWVEREEAAGEGEAPYPPNFPKMPGEPKRVQPSRAKKS